MMMKLLNWECLFHIQMKGGRPRTSGVRPFCLLCVHGFGQEQRKNEQVHLERSFWDCPRGCYLCVHEEGNVAVGELEMCWMLQSNSSCCLSDRSFLFWGD